MLLSVLLTILVTIVAVIFALQNVTVVQVSFFGYPAEGSVGLFLLIALGIGVLLGILLMLPTVISRSVALFRQRRKVAALEKKQREAEAAASPPPSGESSPPPEEKEESA